MELISLNKIYSEFLDGSLRQDVFEGLIYQHLSIDQFKLNFSHWDRDEYDDFVSWIYPRIRKSVNAYIDVGASFDAFLSTVFRMAAKEYRTVITNKGITEYAAWSVRVPEMYAYEESPAYLCETGGEKPELSLSAFANLCKIKRRKKSPKQLLILVLKCYFYISDDFLERVSPILEIDSGELKQMVERIKLIRRKHDDLVYDMRERIYCQFYRCIIYEKKLSLIIENSTKEIKLKEKLANARKRLEKMRLRLTRVRTDATNREVASVMGISKGSVDSNLYILKNKWNLIINMPNLN